MLSAAGFGAAGGALVSGGGMAAGGRLHGGGASNDNDDDGRNRLVGGDVDLVEEASHDERGPVVTKCRVMCWVAFQKVRPAGARRRKATGDAFVVTRDEVYAAVTLRVGGGPDPVLTASVREDVPPGGAYPPGFADDALEAACDVRPAAIHGGLRAGTLTFPRARGGAAGRDRARAALLSLLAAWEAGRLRSRAHAKRHLPVKVSRGT